MNLGFVGGVSASPDWTRYTGQINSADKGSGPITFSNQDTKAVITGRTFVRGTVALSGKVFWPIYLDADAGTAFDCGIGTASMADNYVGKDTLGYGYRADGAVYNNDASIATYATLAPGDIVWAAFDASALKLYFAKNNTWQGSSNPLTGSGGITVSSGTYYPAWSGYVVSPNTTTVVTALAGPPNQVLFA